MSVCTATHIFTHKGWIVRKRILRWITFWETWMPLNVRVTTKHKCTYDYTKLPRFVWLDFVSRSSIFFLSSKKDLHFKSLKLYFVCYFLFQSLPFTAILLRLSIAWQWEYYKCRVNAILNFDLWLSIVRINLILFIRTFWVPAANIWMTKIALAVASRVHLLWRSWSESNFTNSNIS